MDDKIIDLSERREERAFYQITPEKTPVEQVDPTNVALRILATDQEGDHSCSAVEVVAMALAIEQTFNCLTGLCSKDRINKGDLNFLFEALHTPAISRKRLDNERTR